MSEKINGQGFRPLDVSSSARKPAVDGSNSRGSAERSADSTGETVSLTRSALLLGRLEEAIANAPVVDSERVEAIRQAITSGTYEIDAQAVADSIIRLERELS